MEERKWTVHESGAFVYICNEDGKYVCSFGTGSRTREDRFKLANKICDAINSQEGGTK